MCIFKLVFRKSGGIKCDNFLLADTNWILKICPSHRHVYMKFKAKETGIETVEKSIIVF